MHTPSENNKNKIIPFDIARLIKGGEGITFYEGKAFFIADVLPGETGSAKVYEEKPRFGRAIVVERFSSSPDRRDDDDCPFVRQCDGCGFRTPKPECALKYKAVPAYEEISRTAKIDLPPFELYPVGVDSKRRRIRLHWTNDGCGFFARLSHRVVPASQCPAIAEKLQICAEWLEKNTAVSQTPNIPFQIDIQIDLDDDDNAYAAFKPVDQLQPNRRPSKSTRSPNRKNARCNPPSPLHPFIEKIAQKAFDDKIFSGIVTPRSDYGKTLIAEITPSPKFTDVSLPDLPPTTAYRRVGDFAQALPQANALIHALLARFLDDVVKNFPHPPTAADLFAGSGNLTFRIAAKLPDVRAYELFCSPDAFQHGASHNSDAFCPNAHPSLELYDLDAGLPPDAKTADIVVCDPARNGLSPQLARDLCRAQAKFIFYVSCEASSLARDLAVLKQNFSVEKIAFVDMFPHTPHVETIALLSRINEILNCKS